MIAWPDWTGRDVAIIASGPSVKKVDVALLEGRLTTFAIKRNVEIAPWAEAVYGCDYPWWRSVRGLPDYKGLKMAYAEKAVGEFKCLPVQIPDIHSDQIQTGPIGTVGAGGNSGFQALNLAVQFGAKRILLIGFDMHDRGGAHWYGRNMAPGQGNPGPSNFKRWTQAFNNAGETLSGLGIETINASPDSAITSFPKRSVRQALTAWGLLEREEMRA